MNISDKRAIDFGLGRGYSGSQESIENHMIPSLICLSSSGCCGCLWCLLHRRGLCPAP